MSTITKEQIEMYASAADATQTFGMDKGKLICVEPEHMLELARIALASLEAEPVGWFVKRKYMHSHPAFKGQHNAFPLYTAPPAPAPANAEPAAWLWSHRKHPSEVTLVRPEDDERAEGAHWSGWSCQALYAAPPAPVSVPTFEEWCERSEQKPVGWVRDAMKEAYDGCRAAMLQGAENAESRCTIQTAPVLDSLPKIAESPSGNSPVIPDCSCRTCRPVTFTDSRFVVCPECGNKRCPHANDHRNACTGSNEPGQEGSAYPAAPKQEVKNV